MHGRGQNGAQTRKWTGYGFERVADERGFAVVYPDGYEGYWNACNIVGDYAANKRRIDDVGFVTVMVDKLITEVGVDPHRVFATGISRGGIRIVLRSNPFPLSGSCGDIGERTAAGELQMRILGARHFFRHDHERHGGSHQSI